MKLKLCLAAALAAVIALTPLGGAPVLAQSTATLLPPGKQCFQATTGVNGMIGTIGAITGGSGYVAGTYGGVALTGGSGSGATANITVAGGAVTAVTVLNPGTQYVVGDVLSASAASIGGSGSGFSAPVTATSINSSLAGGSVGYYVPSTLTTKQTWQNAAQSVLNQNPVPLDQNGCAIVYGTGSYRQILKDSLHNTVWDTVTTSTGGSGSSSGPTLIGDGAPVGTVWAWPGPSLPSSNWVFAYGQSLSRITYAALFSAITMTQSAVCSSGSTTLSGLADTTQINIDASIEGPCIPPGTFVVSRSGGSVVMNNPATASAVVSVRFLPFGGGDGATTFSIPDYRGFSIIGRNNMGGSATSRISSTYFGNDPNSLNAAGGAQSATLASGNLPPYTPAGTITNGGITITNGAITNGAITTTITNGSNVYNTTATNTVPAAAGALSFGNVNLVATSTQAPTTQATTTANQATSTFSGTATSGTSAPFSIIQSSITANYIIKALPDTNGLFSTGGLIPLAPVTLATTTILPNSPVYNNGSFGVGATLTAGANGALAIDGVGAAFGARVLIKDQVAQAQNGIFLVSAVGDGSNPYVLTRTTDFNSSSNMLAKSYVLVTGGNANAGASFALQNSVTTVGTDSVVFVQVGQAGSTFTQVGTGAITQTVQNKLQERVSILDFGAVAGGSAATNLTAIQNAVNQVVAHGGCLYIPGNGVRAYTIPANTSITIPANTTTFSICGDGPGSSILSFSGPSTTPLISVGAFAAELVIDGVQLTGNQTLPPTDTSTGIALGANSTVIVINNTNIRFFNTGISASSSFVIGINNSFISYNNQGVTLSVINAVNFYHTTIGANYVYGVSCSSCSQFNLYGGTIELNGTNAGGSSSWGIKCNDCGASGGPVGLNVYGTYFEQNGGQADVWITQTTLSTAHSILGSNFNRLSNTQFTTNNILVDGTAPTQVTIQGDSFFGAGGYVANAARQYINLSSTGITSSISNVNYSSSTESAKFSREWNYRTGVGANGGMGFSDQSSVEIGKIVVDGSDNLLLAKVAGGGTFQISSNSGLLLNNVSFPLGAGSANTVPVVTSPNVITYQTVPNAALTNSTISGVALGANLNTLTFGSHLTSGGASYNGSAGVTITSDATSANTASTIVARDGSGNFSAGAGSFTSVSASGANNGQMAANSVKCNNTGSPATSIDCSVAQAQALIIPSYLYSRSSFKITNVDFNTVGDTQINITMAPGAVAYRVAIIAIGNASASLTTATFGVFTGTGGTGTAIQTGGTAITVSTSAANTNNNGQTVGGVNSNTQFLNLTSLQFRVTNPEGSAATADVTFGVDWIY